MGSAVEAVVVAFIDGPATIDEAMTRISDRTISRRTFKSTVSTLCSQGVLEHRGYCVARRSRMGIYGISEEWQSHVGQFRR